MTILSEYQNGLLNARVYKNKNGEYGVVVYDAETDYNGFESFTIEEDAEDYAEDWVLRTGR
jgi:hypothetical protein